MVSAAQGCEVLVMMRCAVPHATSWDAVRVPLTVSSSFTAASTSACFQGSSGSAVIVRIVDSVAMCRSKRTCCTVRVWTGRAVAMMVSPVVGGRFTGGRRPGPQRA